MKLNLPVHTVAIGFDNLAAVLRDRAAKGRMEQEKAVIVGYTAPYAVSVHEAVEMKLKGKPRRGGRTIFRNTRNFALGKAKRASLGGNYWDPEGEAKFLEHASRDMHVEGEYSNILQASLKAGKTLIGALLDCGRALLKRSDVHVPVDTGRLRDSGFVRIE